MLVDFKQKSQVTIPNEIVKSLGLRAGDKLDIREEDGKLIITPVVVIPKDQAWFYSPEWQAMEMEVDKHKKEGKVRSVNSAEELFEDLGINRL